MKTSFLNTRALQLAAPLAAALSLAGCAQGLDGLVESQQSDSFLVTGSVNGATPATALASLPRQAGRVLSVNEQRRADGLQQHIVLSGDALAQGENWIKVDVAARRPTQSVSHAAVHREMQTAFGGRALPVTNLLISNAHGPVGLAFGPVPGMGNCAFMWQTADHSDVQSVDALPLARTPGSWSARVRLCRERLTHDHAVAFAQGLSLGAYSDPLYAPLAEAPVAEAQVIAPSSLASLDEPVAAPVRRTAQRTRTSPPPPVARASQPVQAAASATAPTNAVPIALPGQPSPAPVAPTGTPASAPTVQAAVSAPAPPSPPSETVAIAVPLPN